MSSSAPVTPPPAASELHPPPPRNDHADADSSAQRKRPRLDSGDRQHRSMSAEPSLASGGAAAAGADPRTPPHPTTIPTGTPSRVTINLRAPAPDRLLAHASTSDKSPPLLQSASTNSARPPSPPQGPSTEPTSSADSSPPVEAAEPEDIDGDSQLVYMHPSTSPDDVQANFTVLMTSSFPFYEDHPSYEAILEALQDHLAKHSDQRSIRSLDHLTRWLGQYLNFTQPYPNQWFYFCFDYRELWDALPVFVESVFGQLIIIGTDAPHAMPTETQEPQVIGPIIRFLQTYGYMTARMLLIDAHTLEETASEGAVTPDLFSPAYVRCLARLIRPTSDAQLFKLVTMRASIGGRAINQMIHACMKNFSEQPSFLIDFTLRLLDRGTAEEDGLLANFELVRSILAHWSKPRPQGDLTVAARKAWQDLGLAFFETIDARLQELIRKQSSTLRLDNLKHLLHHLDKILNLSVASYDGQIPGRVPSGYEEVVVNLDPLERARFLEAVWKMGMFTDCITYGHMDARIFGVDCMQDLMVEVYHQYIKDRTIATLQVPLVQYVVEFIRKHQLIEYLLGVGSHRQLIARSKNIVVFLLVADQYTDADTDTIWNAIRNCKEPRVADAIVNLASEILQYSNSHVLHYFFSKFMQLPSAEFEGRLCHLCNALIKAIIRTPEPNPVNESFYMDLHWLFVRVLQDVYGDQSLELRKKQDIRQFATAELRQLLQSKFPGFDRTRIFADCFDQIASSNSKACGSVSILNLLLGPRLDSTALQELDHLQAMFDFTRLIVEDLHSLPETAASLGLTLHEFPELVSDRLALVAKIIVHLPPFISDELLEKIWTSLIGERAESSESRDVAWKYLAQAVASCGARQQNLLDKLVRQHLPALPASFFTPSILIFADQVTLYEARLQSSLENDHSTPSAPPLSDMLWTVALKASTEELAVKSIDCLVRSHLPDLGKLASNDYRRGVQERVIFVDRTIQALTHAASEFKQLKRQLQMNDKHEEAVAPPKEDLVGIKIRFHNSLTILMKVVDLARKMNSDPSQNVTGEAIEIGEWPGDQVTIRYQSFATGKSLQKSHFQIGDQATVKDLYEILSRRTGFHRLRLIAGGTRVDLSGNETTKISDRSYFTQSQILVQKITDSSSNEVSQVNSSTYPLNEEIMQHFHSLYDLLDMDLELGLMVYQFLSSFPPHHDIVEKVCDLETSNSAIFPLDSRFKCAYSLYALQTTLGTRQQEGVFCTELVAHGVRNISTAILALPLQLGESTNKKDFMILSSLTETLVRFLKEPVPSDTSATYFERPHELIDRLTAHALQALSMQVTQSSLKLIEVCFSAILEASLQQKCLRDHVTSSSQTALLAKALLLESPHIVIHQAARRTLDRLFATLDVLRYDDADQYYRYWWDWFQQWITGTAQQPYSSEHFFALAIHVFQSLSEQARSVLPLSIYVTQWSSMLCAHIHSEFVGRSVTNWHILGLSRLLSCCLLSSKTETALQLTDNTVEAIFESLLFTTSKFSSNPGSPDRTPVLDSTTRESLYGLLSGTANDMSRLRKVVQQTRDLLVHQLPSNAWTWGWTHPIDNSNHDVNRAFDQKEAIRSATGYAGLRNLSNTCYLNSLITQLFMNQDFRSFILALPLTDPQGKQRLLQEIKRTFYYLQHTWLHAVSPENVTDYVETYESTPIDVTIQMDVDEFYNLLFDRIENMIPPEEQSQFRKFYGGQIVQQIKSKDCPHISERLEPFSAIQCEIQGKLNLEESLMAYVEGEVMEGDNKYSCGTCGQYVNAIKRACLKDVPDNLIFHLKRFDYDLASGTRNKINDVFEFPGDIDMSRYNVEYLKDTSKPPTSDVFTLVGVLVHAGQAESGHYYSYIRDRSKNSDVWLEFNDSDVTYFDPAHMQHATFGGWNEPTYGTEPVQKAWNAYMLFYRRRSVFLNAGTGSCNEIARSPFPCDSNVLIDRIQHENDLFIQKYCLHYDEHGLFANTLLERFIHLKQNMLCSDKHAKEKHIIEFAMEHTEQIFARQKYGKHAIPMLNTVSRIVEGCPECGQLLLCWVSDHLDGFRGLLLRSPAPKVRQAMANLVLRSLKSIRELNPSAYGLPHTPNSEQIGESVVPQDAFFQFWAIVNNTLPCLHLTNRGWDDFYGLLLDVSKLGSFERETLKSYGVLLHCLQVLIVYSNKILIRHVPSLSQVARGFDRRNFSLLKLIALTEYLIRGAEPESESSSSDTDAPTRSQTYNLDPDELHCLTIKTTKGSKSTLSILETVFNTTYNDPSLSEVFVGTLTHVPGNPRRQDDIVSSLLSCIGINPAVKAETWLHGVVGFCENSEDRVKIRNVLKFLAKDAATIQDSGAIVFLEFFARMHQARNPLLLANEPRFFKTILLQTASIFMPPLLYSKKSEVRTRTFGLLRGILLERPSDNAVAMSQIRCAAMELCDACVRLVDLAKTGRKRVRAARYTSLRQTLQYFMGEFLIEEDDHPELSDINLMYQRATGALEIIELITTSSPEPDSSAAYDSDEAYSDYSDQVAI